MNLPLGLYKLKIAFDDFRRDHIYGPRKYSLWLMNELINKKENMDICNDISFQINVSGSLFIMTNVLGAPIAIKEIPNKIAKQFTNKDIQDLLLNIRQSIISLKDPIGYLDRNPELKKQLEALQNDLNEEYEGDD